jgi:hypothetical protein
VTQSDQTAEIFIRLERRARRDFALRVKQGLSILTSISYGALASALWKPLLEGARFTILGVSFIGMAIGFLAASLYFAPMGEFDAKQ